MGVSPSSFAMVVTFLLLLSTIVVQLQIDGAAGLPSPSPGSSGLAEGSDYGSWPPRWNNMWVCCLDTWSRPPEKYCKRHSGPIPMGCNPCPEGTVSKDEEKTNYHKLDL